MEKCRNFLRKKEVRCSNESTDRIVFGFETFDLNVGLKGKRVHVAFELRPLL